MPVLPGSKSTSRAKGSRRNLGDPAFGQSNPLLVCIGKGEPKADDERTREVGPRRSSCEAGEQAEQSAAESVEQRAGTKGNVLQQRTGRTKSRETVSRVLARIRQTAREKKKERFTALFHHINVELLRYAFFATRREAAPGVDGVTWQAYEANLETNLQELHAGPAGSVSGTAACPGVPANDSAGCR
jgi:hypothetical protein